MTKEEKQVITNQRSKRTLEQIRLETEKDLYNKLKKHHKCVVPRCTGYGKTWLLASMHNKYNKVLFLYPSYVIKNAVVEAVEKMNTDLMICDIKSEDPDFDFTNIRFMTYNKLVRLTSQEVSELSKYDLIIMDECHRIGGEKTSIYIKKLFNICKNSDFVGATATPDRSDNYDVIEEFFSDPKTGNPITVYPYTLHDAIKDGIIQKPYYYYCPCAEAGNNAMERDVRDFFEDALLAGQDVKNIHVNKVLKSNMFQISNLYSMDTNIKKSLQMFKKATNVDTSYMKFIVFFESKKQMDNFGYAEENSVKQWFEQAFPKYSVDITEVSTRNSETSNVERIFQLKHKKNKIDLIFAIDMLNLGYHVKDLTGIVLYRGTSSNIIYIQQLGRSLSTGSENPCMVLDVVDNIHRKSVFNLRREKLRKKKSKPLTSKEIAQKLSAIAKEENCKVLDLKKLSVEEQLEIIDSYEIEHNLINDPKWYLDCNNFTRFDFHMGCDEATEKEFIAKVSAESIIERVRRAIEYNAVYWYTDDEKNDFSKYPKTIEQFDKFRHEGSLPLEEAAKWVEIKVDYLIRMAVDEIQNNPDWYSWMTDLIEKKGLDAALVF